MITILDYGIGNLYSLYASLRHINVDCTITRDESVIKKADRLLLPGVGAFGDAIATLQQSGLDRLVLEHAQKGKPLIGICLGMQLLFDTSTEYGLHKGLGLIPGDIVQFDKSKVKIPHIGWNKLKKEKETILLDGVADNSYVYYVHSYYKAFSPDYTTASTNYEGMRFSGIVQKDNVYGVQFHPEKSGKVGLKILSNFVKNS